MYGERVIVEEMASGRPSWKKNSIWFSMDALFPGDTSALVARFLVRKEEISIDVEASGMRRDFAAIRVKKSDGFLHITVEVGALREVLRSYGKLTTRETRSSLSALSSLLRVASSYWVARMPRTTRILEAANYRFCKVDVAMAELMSWMSRRYGRCWSHIQRG